VLPPPRALLALIISYAGLVTLACVLTTTPSIRPLVAQAFVGAALICGTAATAGAAAWVAGGVLPGVRLMVSWLRLPKPVSRCLRPVGLALVIHLGGALLLLVAAMVIGWDRVLMLHHALAPGVPGGLVLVIAQLAVVPNLVIWSGAFVAGPGFAVGTGTSVLPGHTVLGALPAVPVLGVLPTPSEGPGWAWAVLAFPVLAGAVAGWWILQAEPTGDLPVVVRAALRGTGLTALLAGVCWGVLSWLSGGPAGPGRLAQIGPSPWQVGLAVGIEVGLGALLAVGVGVAIRWRALRWRDESPPAQLGG
jgi:hypothetical protein